MPTLVKDCLIHRCTVRNVPTDWHDLADDETGEIDARCFVRVDVAKFALPLDREDLASLVSEQAEAYVRESASADYGDMRPSVYAIDDDFRIVGWDADRLTVEMKCDLRATKAI